MSVGTVDLGIGETCRKALLALSVLLTFLASAATTPLRADEKIAAVPECAFAYLQDEDFRERGLESMRRLVETLGAEGTYNCLTLTLRCPGHDLSEPETWARIADVATCAHENRMKLIVDCDPRISRTEFLKRWPDAAQELAIVGTNGMPALAWACPRLVDHMSSHGPYASTATREKPFPGGKTVIHTLWSADLFSPQVVQYARELSRRAKDAGADGALRDEWGFPPSNDRIFDEHRAFWYSRRMAEAYAAETGGRNLLEDLPLLAFGPSGVSKRNLIAAYMRLIYRRNAEIERDFYETTKRIFGPDAFVGKHPTWFPVIGTQEFMHNGLDWWAAPRDWAQGDEITPVPALCGMAKKCGTSVWLNEGYQDAPEKYAPLVWRYALAGGRMVYHPVYPAEKTYKGLPYRDLKVRTHSDILEKGGAVAERRIRLLNRISDSPIDSPVALVFGHERVMNWDDPAYGQWGWNDAFGVWKEGYAVDAYPSTEIGTFQLDDAGFLRVGRQRYQVVIFRNLNERDRVSFAGIVKNRTLQTRICERTDDVAAYLSSVKASRQTPICQTVPPAGWASVYPQPDGTLTLTDGTVARIKASAPSWCGDRIEGVLEVGGVRIKYAAEGVFAARLGADGRMEAFAGGNLRYVSGPGFSRTFASPRDIVMKRTNDEWVRVEEALR